MKKNLLYIVIAISLSFISILGFQFLQQKNENNGFHRKILPKKFEIKAELKLPSSFIYFARIDKEGIYLKDLTIKNSLFLIDYSLSKISIINLTLPKDYYKVKKVNIGVVDTAIFLTDNQSGRLTLFSRRTEKRSDFKNNLTWLDETSLISERYLIGRGIGQNAKQLQMNLIKLNYRDNKICEVYDLNEKDNNIFSMDGILQADERNINFFYMYFYRGLFLSLDTNLKLIYKAKTIDTIKNATTKLAKLNDDINNEKEITLTQSIPPKIINRSFTTFQDKLYLLSTLKSDEESQRDFRKNQVVDIYSIKNGNYVGSFYIPKYEGKKMRELRINNDFVIAIFDDFIVKYKIVK